MLSLLFSVVAHASRLSVTFVVAVNALCRRRLALLFVGLAPPIGYKTDEPLANGYQSSTGIGSAAGIIRAAAASREINQTKSKYDRNQSFRKFFVTIARIRVCVKLVKTIYINKSIKEAYITKD